jgi:LPS-assembly protein
MRQRAAVAWFALLPLAFACESMAQTPNGAAPDPPPQLKLSPALEPPPRRRCGWRRARIPWRLNASRSSCVRTSSKAITSSGRSVGARGTSLAPSTVLALCATTRPDQFWAKGNVILRRGIDRITGSEAKFKRSDETDYFTSPEFHIGENASRGDAKELTFVGPNQYELKDVRYTTCVAGNEDWYLTSSSVEVDKSRLVGTAHNATILFKDVPILNSPYIYFPLSNERKSGFLAPLFGSTSSRGIEMSLPYYLNLAPNYDATLTPRFMTRRGLQINGQFRYLFPSITGEADAEILPDRITNTNRYGLTWKHTQEISQIPGLATYVNVQKVSDDAYFTDLSDRLVVTSQQTLPREAGLSYNRGPFGFLARVQSFQTLQDPNSPIIPPYFREPQLLATMNSVEWHDIDSLAMPNTFASASLRCSMPSGP